MRQLIFVALVISGCAYVPRVVHLEQPDKGSPSPICIKVEQFSDARADKKTIGVARNGFYWPTGNATSEDDAAVWIATHLAGSLTPDGCSPEFSLEGRIREIFVDEWFNLNARFVVTLRLERGQKLIFDRDFVTSFSQLSHLGSSAEFEDTLRKGLAEFGVRVMPAIIAAASDEMRPLPPGL